MIQNDNDRTSASVLMQHGTSLEVHLVGNGLDGLRVARQQGFDVLLIDLRLPDVSGLDVVRTLRGDGIGLPFIVLTSHATVSGAVEAMKLGAATIIEKPADANVIVSAVHSVLGLDATGPETGPVHATTGANGHRAFEGSSAARWAELVLSVARSDRDPKTLAAWAHIANVSRTALAERCRLIHVSSHAARDFARMVRAIYCSGQHWQPEAVLDLGDVRTLNKILRRAGLAGTTRVPTLEEFFERQEWIPQINPGLTALRALVARDRAS